MFNSNIVPIGKIKEKVLVTQPYVPTIDKYMHYVEKAFDNKWLTNGGPLLQELTNRLKDVLGVKHLLIVSNGTSALQIAYKIKNLANKTVVTTPFTFPATSTALEWNNSKIRLADIDPNNWNLSPTAVRAVAKEQKIDAIVPVNIFGMPCDMEGFDELGRELNVPIIYDSAQALLSKYKGKSIFEYGDIHCVSFHATKLFHCVEGGAIIFNNKEDFERAEKLINFGIGDNGEVYEAGINAKMSEIHAAMGLCLLDDLPILVENRANSIARYEKELNGAVELQSMDSDHYIPPTYMPVKFATEQQLLDANEALNNAGYQARRYFYPKNHKFISEEPKALLPNSEKVCDKILCLPLMHNLDKKVIKHISYLVKQACK